MKRKTLCLIVGVFFLGMVSIAGAQQDAGKGKPTSGALPTEVCAAIEQYVAKIDAARSVKDKAQREERYAEAQKDFNAVLTRYGKVSLSAEASEYARYSELVVSADPTEPKFAELLAQRLRIRGALLERCSTYTITR